MGGRGPIDYILSDLDQGHIESKVNRPSVIAVSVAT